MPAETESATAAPDTESLETQVSSLESPPTKPEAPTVEGAERAIEDRIRGVDASAEAVIEEGGIFAAKAGQSVGLDTASTSVVRQEAGTDEYLTSVHTNVRSLQEAATQKLAALKARLWSGKQQAEGEGETKVAENKPEAPLTDPEKVEIVQRGWQIRDQLEAIATNLQVLGKCSVLIRHPTLAPLLVPAAVSALANLNNFPIAPEATAAFGGALAGLLNSPNKIGSKALLALAFATGTAGVTHFSTPHTASFFDEHVNAYLSQFSDDVALGVFNVAGSVVSNLRRSKEGA